MNQDWERWGRDIRDIVQDAVDSQDFQKLNETISNTVNDAIFNLRENIRRGPGGPGPGPGMGPEGPGSFGDPGGFGGPRGSWEGQGYQTGQGNGGFAGRQMRQRRTKPPVLFARKGGTALAGAVLLAVGVFFTFSCVCTAIAGAAATLVTGFGGAEAGAFFVLACLAAAGIWMACKGKGMRGRAKRFRGYVEALQGRAYCNISDIAQRTGEKPKRIVKDLRRMIADRWFLQGHMDEQGACLMVTDAAYEEYRRIQQLRREQQQMETERQKEGQQSGRQDGQDSGASGHTPEVQRVIEKGRWYVDKIRECNDAIPGVEISRKIDRIELLVRRIFDRVEADPDAVDDIKKLMEYYLPTTVKLLEAYEQLDAQPEAGENIRQAKEEIEKTLDTLNIAFEKLLDSLFEDVAWDISSDISVLETMLAQEGLTEDGWKRKE